MAVTEGPLFRRMLSDKGRTAISHYFVMDWVSIWKDIAGGLLLAGVLAVFVPKEGWQAFFLTSHPKPTTCWSALVGPIVAVLSFVCSVGNVPLAAVLWNGGSSFGGVLAFIYADLIVLPILNIYRKYYGLRVKVFLFVTMYASMAAAALAIELIFRAVGLVPFRASCQDGRGRDSVELHDVSQHHFSRPHGHARHPVHANWRPEDVQDEGKAYE